MKIIKRPQDTIIRLSELYEGQVVYHSEHGYLRIRSIGYDDHGKKATFECRKYVDGKDTDTEIIFFKDDLKFLSL